MKNILWRITIGLPFVVGAIVGCDGLNIRGRGQLTVILLNAGDYPVDVELRASGDLAVSDVQLREGGTEVNRALLAGDLQRLTGDCADIQSLMVSNAELRLPASVDPFASSDVYRIGEHFDCGDTVTIVFDHPADAIRLEISFVFE